MRSYWSRVGPYSDVTGVLMRREGTHRRRQPCDHRGRDCSDASTGIASRRQELAEEKKDSSCGFQGGRAPVDTLALDS